jgi:hypothetical protein
MQIYSLSFYALPIKDLVHWHSDFDMFTKHIKEMILWFLIKFTSLRYRSLKN